MDAEEKDPSRDKLGESTKAREIAFGAKELNGSTKPEDQQARREGDLPADAAAEDCQLVARVLSTLAK